MLITVSRTIRTPHDEIRALVEQGFTGVTAADVEVHVRARGIQRTFIVLCDRRRCSLEHNFRSRNGGRGHHFIASAREAERIAERHGSPLERRAQPRGRGFSGRAYNGVPRVGRVAPGVAYLVTILMPASPEAPTAHRYPYRWRYARYRRAQPLTIESWQENLIHLSAHEARHIHQYRAGLPASELDAERWAAQRLAEWRGDALVWDART
ncbi:MAG: hypothetical protein ACTHNU_16865 [Gaiellales bacterium]